MPNRKFPVAKAKKLLKPSLESSIDPNALITLLPLRKNLTIADVGCGPGYLSIPLAKYLYEGKLYAIDVQKKMLSYVTTEAENVHLKNVVCVLSKENKVPLEDEILDGAFTSGVIHEADAPPLLMKEMCRLLKPGGWLAIVDWRKDPFNSEVGPPAEVRMGTDAVRDFCKGAGLKCVSVRMLQPDRFFLLFRKGRG